MRLLHWGKAGILIFGLYRREGQKGRSNLLCPALCPLLRPTRRSLN